MKRIIKVLVASALMVMLMATTVSPAFAANDCKPWWSDCRTENPAGNVVAAADCGEHGNSFHGDDRTGHDTEDNSCGKY